MKIIKANSPKQLYELLDTCNECVRNLSVLGLETNQLAELIIINQCVAKLHEDIIHRNHHTLLHIYEVNHPINEENIVAVSRGIQIQP